MTDTERLDWFEKHPGELLAYGLTEGFEFCYCLNPKDGIPGKPWRYSDHFGSVRDCIDAAIQAEQQKGENNAAAS